MANERIEQEIVVNIKGNNSDIIESTEQANKALTDLGNNDATTKLTKGGSNLRTALKEAQNEAQRLLLANKANTKEYQDAIARVAEIRDQQQLYNRAVESNDAGNRLMGVSKSAGIASASVATLSQTFKSVGVNSEALEGTVVVLQSIMGLISLIDAIPDIGDYLVPFRNRILGVAGATEAATIATVEQGIVNEATAVSTSVLATANESAAIATEGATVATKGLGVALKTVGIGLLISALAFLVTNFDKVKKVIQDIFPELKDSGKLWDDFRLIVFGVGNVIKEFLIAPIVAFVQILKGDFRDALITIGNSANVINNFHKGVAYEQKQIDIEHKKEALEREQEQLENTIKILKASGDAALKEQRRVYQIKKELAELSDKDDKEKAKEIAAANVESIVFETNLIKEKNDKIAALNKEAEEKLKAQRKADYDAAIAQDKEALKVISDAFLTDRNKEEIAIKSKYKEREDNLIKFEKSATAKELKELKLKGTSISKMRTDLFSAESLEMHEINEKYDKVVNEYLDNQHDNTLNAYDKRVIDLQKKGAELVRNANPEQIKIVTDSITNQIKNVRTEQILNKRTESSSTDLKTVELNSVINDNDTPDVAYQKVNALEAAKLLAESDSFELKKQQLQGQNEALQQLSAEHNNNLTEIAKTSAEARKKIDDLEYDNKLKLYSGISAAGSAASDILGQNTLASKSLAVAASLISTYAAIAGQLKAFAGVPIPGYAIAQAVATGIAGFAAVKNILSVKVPVTGGSGSSGSGTSGLNSAPVINSTVLADRGTQDVRLSNDTINVKSDTGLQPAYIVDKELTNREEEKAFIERTRSI